MSHLEADDRLDDVLRALADRVRALRRERQLSVSDLAFESGLSEARLRAVETGRTTSSLATLLALAETFEITLADLFRDASAPAPAEEWVEPSSPYVVPSAVVWGGELPPAPWVRTETIAAAGTGGSAPEPAEPAVAESRAFAPTEEVWGGPLPPAPWMPAAPASTTPAVGSPTVPLPELPPGGAATVPPEPSDGTVAHRASTAAVVRTHDHALAHGMRENSAYVFVAPGAAPRAVPRTFSDLRTGPLAGRHFRSLQEFAVAAVVEGGHALADVARVFRIPAWRLEQWVIETGHVAR